MKTSQHARKFLVWATVLKFLAGTLLAWFYQLNHSPGVQSDFITVQTAIDIPGFSFYIFKGQENYLAMWSWLYQSSAGLLTPTILQVLLASLSSLTVFMLANSLVTPTNQWPILLILFPGVVFWSSITGKDPITFSGFCLCLWALVSQSNQTVGRIVVFLLGATVLWAFRFWLLIPILMMTGYQVTAASQRQKQPHQMLLIGITFTISFFFLLFFIYQLHLYSSTDLLARINAVTNSWNHGSSGNKVPVFTSLPDLLFYFPRGAFQSLFYPLPGMINNGWGLAAGLESLALLAAAAYRVLLRTHGITLTPHEKLGLLGLIGWLLIYTWLSPQNLGTAVRFRLIALPLFLIGTSVVWQTWLNLIARGAQKVFQRTSRPASKTR